MLEESREPLTTCRVYTFNCPRGAAWSARHPVTVEAVGSNPIGDALNCGMQNSDCGLDEDDSAIGILKSDLKWRDTPIWQSDQAQTLVDVGSNPSRAT